MATTAAVIDIQTSKAPVSSRIVFTEGGKGGVGKTAFTTALAEWYRAQHVSVSLVDMDTENKSRGSLAHFFPEAKKSNIQRARGLDDLIMDDGEPIVLADMGAGAGEVAHQWFDSMHGQALENGVAFTAIGLVTPDPASVSSVLAWAKFLQNRVDYLIVLNSLTNPADFSYWENDPAAQEFRSVFHPTIISMEFRLTEIEHEAREHGLTIQAIAERRSSVPALCKTVNVWRAQAYRRNLFAELDRAKRLLLL
jgi:MinD-like ATPase involved in chromosome partitioning or flagellar assembly